VTYAGNFLVFGHGPHYCVGKEYAINHLMAFLAITSTSLDWQRTRCACGCPLTCSASQGGWCLI
jgi:cytochrome P450